MSGSEMAGPMQSGSGTSSADFVRKLYNMLEDHRNRNAVRWGNDGDTFVVLETEAFTRSVLPKHFKHGNFASFVRQLNKYDFHKVKRPEDGTQSPYGPNASEFKHPDFKANREEDLYNIRRKAPVTRKPTVEDPAMASQSIAMLNDQSNATQAQVQQLQEKVREMAHSHQALIEEVRDQHKVIRAQKQAQQEMLNYLTFLLRRDGQVPGHSVASTLDHRNPDDSPTELRQAREFLMQADRDLERMSAVHGASFGSVFGNPDGLGVDDPLIDLTKYPVYPAGQSIGIDPFHSDHINNVPYPLPPASLQDSVYAIPSGQNPAQSLVQSANVVSQAGPTTSLATPSAVAASVATVQVPTQSLSSFLPKSPWGKKKPRILLAEDDPTCSRIGSKFLHMIDCRVEIATDGISACSIVSTAGKEYIDLVLMDIVMPQMDGVSATAKIRQTSPQIPIIAMTSNVKPDEVQMYVEAGMNGILPKPFTLDRMFNALKAHLPHLLDGYVPDSDIGFGMSGYNPSVGTVGTVGSIGNVALPSPLDAPGSSVLTGGGIVKFETTPPAHSPSATTSTSWHSPGGYTQPSPTPTHGTMDLASGSSFAVGLNGNGQLVATAATTPGAFSAEMPPPGSGGSGILEERAAKRSKLHVGQSAGPAMGYTPRSS